MGGGGARIMTIQWAPGGVDMPAMVRVECGGFKAWYGLVRVIL